MEKNKLGIILIVLGISLAILPMIIISGFAYYSKSSLGALSNNGLYAFFIIGIVIAIIGEKLRR